MRDEIVMHLAFCTYWFWSLYQPCAKTHDIDVGLYHSKTLSEHINVSYEGQLCPVPLLLSHKEHPMQKQHSRSSIDTMKSLSPAPRTLKPLRIRSNRCSQWHHFIRLCSLITRRMWYVWLCRLSDILDFLRVEFRQNVPRNSMSSNIVLSYSICALIVFDWYQEKLVGKIDCRNPCWVNP